MKRVVKRKPRKKVTKKRSKKDPFKSGFKKRAKRRSNGPAPVKKKKRLMLTNGTPKRKVNYSTRATGAPRERKSVSAEKIIGMTKKQVKTRFTPTNTPARQSKGRVSKFKTVMRESAKIGSKVMNMIETTGRVAGKVAQTIEPMIDAASVMNPSLLPFAIADTGIAETARMIEKTSKLGANTFKVLTDTGKYQKMMGSLMQPPKINLMDYTAAEQAKNVPLPQITDGL